MVQMKGQPFQVSLPGTAYQRGQCWWWYVKLPGEDRPRARALKPKGQKTTTKDLQTAAQVAFELWEQAVRDDAQRRVRIDADEKIARLKAKFLQKMHDVSQVVNRLPGRDGVEVGEKATGNVQPTTGSCDVEVTMMCGCCESRDVPPTALRPIDSGQLLCPACLAELKAAAGISESRQTKGTPQEMDQALPL